MKEFSAADWIAIITAVSGAIVAIVSKIESAVNSTRLNAVEPQVAASTKANIATALATPAPTTVVVAPTPIGVNNTPGNGI